MSRIASSLSFAALSCALIAGSATASSDVTAPITRPAPSAARGVEELLGKLQREERSARERFDQLGTIADTAGRRALARGRAFTRLARAGLLPIGGGFRAFIEHATRIERLRQGLARDVAEEQRAIAERRELARKLEDLRARLAPLQVEQQAMARAEAALLSADDRERAFQRAFQSSLDPHTAVYGALGPSDPLDDAAGFAAKRGRLPFPLAGRAEIRRARRSGSEGPGLEMRAPLGTPVRAVHAGRVAFADDYADYGKTVIIDHGGRYYTVSANLGTIEVAVGDELATNARLGTVGDNGQGALVYFEIRAPRGSADPSEWFGI